MRGHTDLVSFKAISYINMKRRMSLESWTGTVSMMWVFPAVADSIMTINPSGSNRCLIADRTAMIARIIEAANDNLIAALGR